MPINNKLWSSSQQCFLISFFSQLRFLTDLLCSSERDFKDRLYLPKYSGLLRSYYSQFQRRYFGLQNSLCKVAVILWDLSIRHGCSIVLWIYGKFILMNCSSWISAACVCFCDWDKLRLLIILLKILLKMLFWYPFSFNTCFILAFSLVKSSLLVITEYALLNKEEIILSLLLVWWWEL